MQRISISQKHIIFSKSLVDRHGGVACSAVCSNSAPKYPFMDLLASEAGSSVLVHVNRVSGSLSYLNGERARVLGDQEVAKIAGEGEAAVEGKHAIKSARVLP